MSKLPAVRLPSVLHADGDSEGQEAVVVELPPSNKFSFAWPSEPPASFPLPVLADRPPDLGSSDQESGLSETESNGFLHSSDEKEDVVKRKRADDHVEETDFTPTNRLYNEQNPMDQAAGPPPPLPRLSRAFSVPLPSQVDHLKNPRRTTATSEQADYPSSPRPIELSPELSQFHELSLELADSVQMVIQMLLQLSPPQVLDPAKEQFSACSLPIPTPSITAMFTSMKNLNYMSANIASFSMPHQPPRPKLNPEDPTPPHSPASILTPVQIVDFDIGEAIQSVGDAVSGIAAEAGIDLVLFHGDVGMKHIAVRGDDSGLSYTLSHVRLTAFTLACALVTDTYVRLSDKSSVQLTVATVLRLGSISPLLLETDPWTPMWITQNQSAEPPLPIWTCPSVARSPSHTSSLPALMHQTPWWTLGQIAINPRGTHSSSPACSSTSMLCSNSRNRLRLPSPRLERVS